MWFIQHTSFDEQLLYSYFADTYRTYGWIKKPRMNDPVRVWIGPLLVEMLACMHILSLSCFSKCYVFLVHIIFLLHILPFSQNIYYLFLVYITLFLCILPFSCTYYLFPYLWFSQCPSLLSQFFCEQDHFQHPAPVWFFLHSKSKAWVFTNEQYVFVLLRPKSVTWLNSSTLRTWN